MKKLHLRTLNMAYNYNAILGILSDQKTASEVCDDINKGRSINVFHRYLREMHIDGMIQRRVMNTYAYYVNIGGKFDSSKSELRKIQVVQKAKDKKPKKVEKTITFNPMLITAW